MHSSYRAMWSIGVSDRKTGPATKHERLERASKRESAMEMECALQHLTFSDCSDVSPARLVERHATPSSPILFPLRRGC